MTKKRKSNLKLGMIGMGPRSAALVHSAMWAGNTTINYICDSRE